MNYEQKYKDALERAKKWHNAPNADKIPTLSTRIIEEIFPELRESEDEKIRKAIHIYLDWLDGRRDYQPKGEYTIKDMIAWLEKQEVLSTKEELQGKEDVLWCIKQASKYAKDENEMGTYWFAEKWLEKQGEKKPTDEEMKELLRTEYEKGRADAIAETQVAWSEEDEKQARQIERIVHNNGCTQKLQKQIADWLKSLKDKVQPKQEWSKDDEEMLYSITHYGDLKPSERLWLNYIKQRMTNKQ